MDTPDLRDYIRFSGRYHSPGAGFLQMNGFAFREEKDLLSIMRRIRDDGVELIDLTLYGTEEYHDRFAGRKGNFRLVMQMPSAAAGVNLPVNISIPLLQSNLNQLEELTTVYHDIRRNPTENICACSLYGRKGKASSLGKRCMQ